MKRGTRGKLPKPRDPAAHLKSQGALRQRVIASEKKKLHRKRKHRKGDKDD